ncbi:MAG: hypothetical protein DWH78_06155 [Planctomycetota bacterium]|nr:MAG: hypothetical protein DWH78_06155 [Planctomycetota bacterium]
MSTRVYCRDKSQSTTHGVIGESAYLHGQFDANGLKFAVERRTVRTSGFNRDPDRGDRETAG